MDRFEKNMEKSKRRFEIDLFIKHPLYEPETITNALGLEPKVAQRVGDRRITPKGNFLEGNYLDTRWRYSLRHTVTDQWFAHEIAVFVDSLMNHKFF